MQLRALAIYLHIRIGRRHCCLTLTASTIDIQVPFCRHCVCPVVRVYMFISSTVVGYFRTAAKPDVLQPAHSSGSSETARIHSNVSVLTTCICGESLTFKTAVLAIFAQQLWVANQTSYIVSHAKVTSCPGKCRNVREFDSSLENVGKLANSRGSVGEKSCHWKLFIVNFMFGAMPVFSSIMRHVYIFVYIFIYLKSTAEGPKGKYTENTQICTRRKSILLSMIRWPQVG